MGDNPFDPMVVTSLNELDDGFFDEMLEVFMSDLARTQNAVRVAFDEQDLSCLAEQVHRLRSAAANLGAKRLEQICGELEASARDHDGDAVDEHVWSFYAEVARIFTWVNRSLAA